MELSKRLSALVGLAEPGVCVADVGCDHGYVSIRLVRNQMFQRAIAMDVRTGPLNAAEKNIAMYGLTDKIQTRLSDGLHELKEAEADTVICAGMGGALMVKILSEGFSREKIAIGITQLILQPQSEVASVRKYLSQTGFRIVKEDMVYEDGKYYPMFRAIRCAEQDTGFGDEADCVYGPLLLENKHPVLKTYLVWEKGILEGVLDKLNRVTGEQRIKERIEQVEYKLQLNRQALLRFDAGKGDANDSGRTDTGT